MKTLEILGLPRVAHYVQYHGTPEGGNCIFKQPAVEVVLGSVVDLDIPTWAKGFALYRQIVGQIRVDGKIESFGSHEVFDLACYAIRRNKNDLDEATKAGQVLVGERLIPGGKLWVTRAPTSRRILTNPTTPQPRKGDGKHSASTPL